MKPYLLLLSILFFACNQNSTEPKTITKDTTEQPATNSNFKNVIADSSTAENMQFIWHVDFFSKTKKRNLKVSNEYQNVDNIISTINATYPNIKLDKVKISGDTLFTKIENSRYLSEGMGTSGPAMYIAEVVINLTSVDKINFVKIDFKEGSHASPDVWSAKDFSDYKEIR